jgi:hypothetical protein
VIQLMLALLVLVRLRIACVVRGALRCIGFVLRTLERSLLVALLRARRAFLPVERKLFLANIGLHRAHLVTRLVDTVVHEKLAITVMYGDCIVIIVLRAAVVQDRLPCIETVT